MADTETETTATTPAAKTLTRYVILSLGDTTSAVVVDRNIAAVSAESAIRRLEQEGTFVAIPARSWKPVTVTARQTTTLDLKPAT